MFSGELEARKAIVRYSHKVHAQGLVCATDGNLSVRLDERHVLITPSSLRKEEMFIEAPIIIDIDGNPVAGDRRPSTEFKVHLEAYRQRADVRAVIHAHPPKAIAFTIAGAPLDTCMLPEVVVTMGAVPVAPYAAPSTEALPESMREAIRSSDVVMLARHGSVTVGENLADAFKKLEKLEHNAAIMIWARLLGGPQPFSSAELAQLEGLREFYGVNTKHVACVPPPTMEPPRVAVDHRQALQPPEAGGSDRSGSPHHADDRQAPTWRGTHSDRDRAIDALVDEIVARVKARG